MICADIHFEYAGADGSINSEDMAEIWQQANATGTRPWLMSQVESFVARHNLPIRMRWRVLSDDPDSPLTGRIRVRAELNGNPDMNDLEGEETQEFMHAIHVAIQEAEKLFGDEGRANIWLDDVFSDVAQDDTDEG